jgi:hypothetical protein
MNLMRTRKGLFDHKGAGGICKESTDCELREEWVESEVGRDVESDNGVGWDVEAPPLFIYFHILGI